MCAISKGKTDKLAIRLTSIITRLNSGEILSVKALAEEFAVTERSIQKDLNERVMQFLPITKKNGQYYMESYLLGKLSYDNIRDFALLSGVNKLYPTMDDHALSDILNTTINDSILIKGADYEDISSKKSEFDLIRLAIVLNHQLCFTYNDKKRVVNPYKLVNNNDIWYLVADENGELKTYSFTKMEQLCKTEKSFLLNSDFKAIINDTNNKWFSKNKIKVILEIDSSVTEYFLRRELLPHQVVLQQTDEKLIVQTTIAYEEEVLKIVRYWIPNIKIIEPEDLQEKLINTLNDYITT